MPETIIKDVIIIGAGASGLMCAISAGRRGRDVLVIDHASKIAPKIRISGGGFCNFTNTAISADNYVSQNPHFCKSALAGFTPRDFLDILDSYHVPYYEKTPGRYFCRSKAGVLVDALYKECGRCKTDFLLNRHIRGIEKGDRFKVRTDDGEFQSESLVIASGSPACPQIGATALGYEIAGRFQHRIVAPRPALTPLSLSGKNARELAGLSGVSLNVRIKMGKRSLTGEMLFTHKGLSGPVILDASLYAGANDVLIIDLLPGLRIEELFKSAQRGKTALKNFLGFHIPGRLAEIVCPEEMRDTPLNKLSAGGVKVLSEALHAYELKISGPSGYRQAEVAAGGVDTGEISSKTMESRKVPGLFFTGEVLDVTGMLGGYNLQWAWSSGWAAGLYV